jgi:hypothetical protein
MSYCNINDAFENIDYKLINNQDNNINYKNIIFENVNNQYNTYNDDLAGTNLSNLENFDGNLDKVDYPVVEKKENLIKLTHRECIKIYCYPHKNPNNLINNAMKHISRCNMCKNEIKRMNKEKETVEKENLNREYNNITEDSLFTDQETKIKDTLVNNTTNDVIEKQLKILNDNICKEQHLKYQNLLMQNSMSKCFEDIEEKKILNNKINKILELLANNSIEKMANNHNQNNNFNYNSIEINYITIAITIIILLLIIDIILRFKN